MTKRTPLPYSCLACLDDALMSIAVAKKHLKPLIEKSDLETVARVARALDELNHAANRLHEAHQTTPEEL